MATSWSKAQNLTFSAKIGSSAAANAQLVSCVFRRRTPLFEVSTGTGATTAKEKAAGLQVYDVLSRHADNALGKAQLSKVDFEGTSFDSLIKVHSFTIRKAWTLQDITGGVGDGTAADTEKEFAWEMPELVGSFVASCAGDPDHTLASFNMTATFNVYGTALNGAMMIQGLEVHWAKARGGRIPITGNLVSSGAITGTGDIFNAIADPPAGTLSLTTTSGPTLSGNALCYVTGIRCNLDAGGPLMFDRAFRFSAA